MLNLTPTELFFLYETLVKSNASGVEEHEETQILLQKIRTELVDQLESVQAEASKTLYEVWKTQETQKVKDLSKKNDELMSTPLVTPKKKSTSKPRKKNTKKKV